MTIWSTPWYKITSFSVEICQNKKWWATAINCYWACRLIILEINFTHKTTVLFLLLGTISLRSRPVAPCWISMWQRLNYKRREKKQNTSSFEGTATMSCPWEIEMITACGPRIIDRHLLTIAGTKTLQAAEVVFDSTVPLLHGTGPMPQCSTRPSTKTGLCLQCTNIQHKRMCAVVVGSNYDQ